VRIEDYAESLRDHRVLHLLGKGQQARHDAADRVGVTGLEACRD
jgi:integrase/recombinase XerD